MEQGMRDTVRISGYQLPSQDATGSEYVPLNWLDKELPDPNDQRRYVQERVVIAVTEAIAEAMEHAGLKRSDVAEKLGRTRSHISQLLSGRRNLTLRSLGDVLWACGVELDALQLSPLGRVLCPAEQAEDWYRHQAAQVDGSRVTSFLETYSPVKVGPAHQIEDNALAKIKRELVEVPPHDANSNLATAA